jgi:hypothetical protein
MHFKGISGACEKCNSIDYFKMFFITLAGLAVFLCVSRRAYAFYKKHLDDVRSLAPKVRMVVGAYQILQQMHGVLDIEYPPMVKEALRWFEFVNLDGFHIFPGECLEHWEGRGYTAYYLKTHFNNLLIGSYVVLLVFALGVLRSKMIEGGPIRGVALWLAGMTLFVTLTDGSPLAVLMGRTAQTIGLISTPLLFALCPPARRLMSPVVNTLLSLHFTLDVFFLIQVPRSANIAAKLACKHFDDGSALSPPSLYQMPCVEQLDWADWLLGATFYPVRATTKCSISSLCPYLHTLICM